MASRTLPVVFTCLTLVQAEGVLSQTPVPLTWEKIFPEDYGAGQAVLSPEGKWAAVTAQTARGGGIYLVPTTGGEPALWVEGYTPSWASDTLRKHGKELESKTCPGEPHGFRNPRNRIDIYRRLEAFFDKHLRR